MLVRTTPKGNNKVVVTEDEARGIDMEWAKINGTYDDIIRKEEDLNKIRKQKEKIWKRSFRKRCSVVLFKFSIIRSYQK